MTRQMTLNHWMDPPTGFEADIDFEMYLTLPKGGYWLIKLPYGLWTGSLIQMDCMNDNFIL